jgi:hypothetical protein
VGKKLKRSAPLSGGKIRPHDAPHVNWDQRPPVFSFQHLVRDHGVDGCDQEQKAQVLEALHRRGQLTWAQLKQAHRHGLGAEPIARNSMRVGVPACVTPDTPILAFRCIGIAPMIGFREEDRFHILWIDRAFACYRH